jgi:hypothetical protein
MSWLVRDGTITQKKDPVASCGYCEGFGDLNAQGFLVTCESETHLDWAQIGHEIDPDKGEPRVYRGNPGGRYWVRTSYQSNF